tara:strand:+ start:370 stop:1152 length:783 start_codon:yes stop_codon:yes gene_type:complete
MLNIYNTISDMDIGIGVTKRMNCPNCNGYNTLTITNNMGSLVWNCYKVSCGVKGGTRVHISTEDIQSVLKINQSQVGNEKKDNFVLPQYVLPRRDMLYMNRWCARWQLNQDELGLLYDVKEDRVVFPVVHDGKIVDATGRTLSKRIPKWKRYGNSDLPYVHGCGSVAVVVEDCVSAAVVGSDVLVGVAVLGTSLSEAHKQYLSQFSTAVIALDPDALPKTLAFAKELRGYVSDVRVLKLNDDLKYRDPTDLEKLTDIGDR